MGKRIEKKLKENSQSDFSIKPMDQFIIEPLFTSSETLQWYSFTNQSLWMLISIVGIGSYFVLELKKRSCPGKLNQLPK